MIKIGYYLRHCGNLHYFAAFKPYLDYFLRQANYQNHIIVRSLDAGDKSLAEYAGYTELLTSNRDLDSYDLVLSPTFLRAQERSRKTRAVQIFHGMSDKSFTYQRNFSDYAACLCVGQRQIDRLLRYPHNQDARIALVGYPKFDSVPEMAPVFNNGKKTLIYCPTWRKEGLSSIERFLIDGDTVAGLARHYNIIVKPHPNLFNPRRPYFDARIVERLGELESIPGIKLIRAGNVMPWFEQADLFLGDISASGYEWLYFAKPMIFLNPQPGVLQPSQDISALTFLWQCGDVCDDLANLPTMIAANLATDRHRDVRDSVLGYSVYHPRDRGATQRGVQVLEGLLSGWGKPPTLAA